LKVIGEEEVRVPAGSFRAWRIHGEIRGTISTVADRWFVRGIGSVKESVTERSPTGELLARNTLELISLPTANSSESAAPGPKKLLEASVSTSTDGDPLTTISADALQIVGRQLSQDRDVGRFAIPDAVRQGEGGRVGDADLMSRSLLEAREELGERARYRARRYQDDLGGIGAALRGEQHMERRNREHDPPVHHASLLKASNSVGKRREAAHGPVIKGVLAQPDVGFI